MIHVSFVIAADIVEIFSAVDSFTRIRIFDADAMDTILLLFVMEL